MNANLTAAIAQVHREESNVGGGLSRHFLMDYPSASEKVDRVERVQLIQ